ncbi:MAG: hypothetical protein K940chlam3_00152 [Chlamydiae bacterium]|nr:hypothetical protein [Chlamydiota bacterium]
MNTQVSFVSSLLPASVVKNLESPSTRGRKECTQENRVLCVSKLLINLIKGAASDYREGLYIKFDGNPGDSGCQNQALALRTISRLDLEEEFSSLASKAKEIQEIFNQRCLMPRKEKRKQGSPFELFQRCFSKIEISKEMEYLLHCYLSAVMRAPVKTEDNGVVLTRCEINNLSNLSENITYIPMKRLKKILNNNKEILSVLSVNAVECEAKKLTSVAVSEKELIVKMLSPEHRKTIKCFGELRTFGCLFYEVKTLIFGLRERQDVVCLRKILKEGDEPVRIFLKPSEPGGEFQVILKESVPDNTPVTVFEAVFKGNREEVCSEIEERGFTELILIEGAVVPQYDPKSKLEEVKDELAREEISRFREIKRPIFELDHVYFTKKEETGLCQEGRKWIVV